MLILDTTCQGFGKISWEGIYALRENENLKEIEEEATVDGTDESENTLNDLASSFLHQIAARVKVLPYNDMVKWVIQSINIIDRAFFTTAGRMFGSFKPEDVKRMYHLLNPQQHYNKSFLEAFAKENQIKSNPIKQWRHMSRYHDYIMHIHRTACPQHNKYDMHIITHVHQYHMYNMYTTPPAQHVHDITCTQYHLHNMYTAPLVHHTTCTMFTQYHTYTTPRTRYVHDTTCT